MTEEEKIIHHAEIFKALGHPTRLAIVKGLVEKDECNVTKMVNNIDISQSTISQHLAILRRIHIVKCTKRGQEVCYKVEDEKIKKIIASIS